MASFTHRIAQLATAVTLALFVVTIAYNYAAWRTHNPAAHTDFGISFSKQFAQYLGLDWKAAYTAMLDDLGARRIRINAYWNDIERDRGVYDFADTDWQLDQATKRGARVVFVLGRRQPRWPECHDPVWVRGADDEEQRTRLLAFIETVVKRYRDTKAIEVWQVENEPFLTIFGDCPAMTAAQLQEEVDLVRSLDGRHLLVTDSGELSTWRKAIHAADLFGTTMYRRTWTPVLGYGSYWWIPAGLYRVKAYLWGRPIETVWNMELQAEPWFAADPLRTPVSEQEKTMNPDLLRENFDYARASQLPRAYAWGAEWWYWMKEKQGDARYWEIAKNYIR